MTTRPALLVPVAVLVLGIWTLGACQPGVPEEKGGVNPAAHTHGEPGETCFICDASKRDPKRLWCVEHGRYEDRCWDCHPELRDAKRLYCKEHGVYEDECPICHPGPDAPADHSGGDGEQAAAGPAAEPGSSPSSKAGAPELFCNEHQVPEAQCAICQPQLAAALPVGKALLVRLPSERSAELAGLTFGQAVPAAGAGSARLQLLGEVRYDGDHHARVSPLAAGVVSKISTDVGEVVEPGQVLAIINSSAAAAAKADYLSARAELAVRRKTLDRQRKLVPQGASAQRTLDEAQAAHRMAQVAQKLARQRLLNLGFTARDLKSLRMSEASSSDLYVRAPFRGTIVARSAVRGELVEVGAALFEVADLEKMWIEIAVPEEDAANLRTGTPIKVSVRALKGREVGGELTWVSPVLDERTRMVSARGVLPNPGGLLRNGMFADVTALAQDDTVSALVLPSDAVQRISGHPFVFVRVEPGLFAAQRVEVGARLKTGQIPVLSGLDADKTVVTKGSFSLKSAFLASRLGAGCTDD